MSCRTLILFLGLLCTTLMLPAQDLLRGAREAIEGRVYALDHGQARELAMGRHYRVTDAWLQDLVAKFPAKQFIPDELPPGQYISTRIVGPKIEWTYMQVTNATVLAENDLQRLRIKVLDLDGAPVPDALVRMDDEILAYDAFTETYVTARRKKVGLLEVEVDGVTQFLRVQHQGGNNAVQRPGFARQWILRPVEAWVLKPVVLTLTLPYDIIMSALQLRLRGWPQWLAVRSMQAFHFVRHGFAARYPAQVLVVGQPRYRPGDTVRLKAYLTTPKGDPLRSALRMVIRDRNGQVHDLGLMQRYRPGGYTGSFVLRDSLNMALDAQQTVELRRARNWQYQGPVEHVGFYYEDYELKQFTFTARAQSTEHWKDERPVLYLEAKDMNNLTLPDARGRIQVRARNVTQWAAAETFLPDTLWTWEGPLDPAGETRLEIALDRFPAAAFDYEVTAECWSSDNEHKSQTLTLNYRHDFGIVRIVEENDHLRIDYLEAGQSIPKTAQLSPSPSPNIWPQSQEIQLPARIPVNPTWAQAVVMVGNVRGHWAAQNGYADIQVRGQHQGDSIKISAASRKGTDFAWHLFEGDREIASGRGTSCAIARKARFAKAYTLNVHGVRAGAAFSQDYPFSNSKTHLQVDWKGPSTIYPGMTTDIALEVHNRRGKPVRGADLTAYAVNGRFEGQGGPMVQAISKTKPGRRQWPGFTIPPSSSVHGTLPLKYKDWAQQAGLDTLAWYQFLYPGDKLYQYRHAIEDSHKAELAPFVVRGGQIQPVQIVYLDGYPVYFAWSQPALPYSFPVIPGRKYMVEIRLPETVLRLDTFRVAPGYKTILSMDLDHLPKRVTTYKVTPKPEQRERSVIEAHSFEYRNYTGSNPSPSIISFGDRVFPLSVGTNVLAGPLDRLDSMRYERFDAFTHTLMYEPGFEYDFDRKLLRMRTANRRNEPAQLNALATQVVEARPWVRDSLYALYRRSRAPRPAVRAYRSYSGWDACRTVVEFAPTMPDSVPRPVAYILHDSAKNHTQVVAASAGNMSLPAGRWTLSMVLPQERYVRHGTVDIRRHGQNHITLDYAQAQIQDSVPAYLFHVIEFLSWTDHTTYSNNQWFDYSKTVATSGVMVRVRGKVTDVATGEPMVSAMVYCNHMGVGCITDLDGSFEMSVPIETDTIVVRYLGYETLALRWQRQTWLDIKVAESSILLNEVVVVTSPRNYQVDAMMSTSMDMISSKNIETIGSVAMRMPGVDGSMDGSLGQFGKMEVTNAKMETQVPAFPEELLAELEGKGTLRKDFRDHAIWEPSLRSDRGGAARFRVQFPEDITRWDAYAVAVDGRGRVGLTAAAIKSWKPLAGRLAMPRFLMEGDTCQVIGKAMNYTGAAVPLRRHFAVDGQDRPAVSGDCGPVLLDTLELVAARDADSVEVSYYIEKADGYGDGEQLGVRVFPVGVMDASGHRASMFFDTTVTVTGLEASRGPVRVHATTRMHELLLMETASLGNYQHLCNEQLSSKLIAALTEQKIFDLVGREWHGTQNVKQMIRLIEKRYQVKDGVGWGWWPGMQPELWVSAHVTKALLMARGMGYEVRLNMLDWVPALLLRFGPEQSVYSNVSTLELVQSVHPTLDITRQIASFDTVKGMDLRTELAIMELRQRAGMPVDIARLEAMAHHEQGYRMWWSRYNYRRYHYYYWYQDLEPTLTAYRILRQAGRSPRELMPLLAFLLEQRGTYGWGNTYLTAQVLHTLVADLGREDAIGMPHLTLHADGKDIPLPMDSTVVFPTVPQQLTVQQDGVGLVFFNAFQRWWNRDPHRVDSLLIIDSHFIDERNELLSDTLVAGKTVRLRVTVQVLRDLDYVMLQVPIPAGCSYGRKYPGHGYWAGYEFHREYFREKVVSYFRDMHRGTYTMDVELLPRYGGRYVLNAARAEQMYLPLYAGQNDWRKVGIR